MLTAEFLHNLYTTTFAAFVLSIVALMTVAAGSCCCGNGDPPAAAQANRLNAARENEAFQQEYADEQDR